MDPGRIPKEGSKTDSFESKVEFVQADVKKTTAGSTISRNGTSIGLGQRTTRIVLDPDNPIFNVEVEISKSQSFIERGYRLGSQILPKKASSYINRSRGQTPSSRDFVPLSIKNSKGDVQKISVNVNDLAARTHLKPDAIREAAGKGELEGLIEGRRQRKVVKEGPREEAKTEGSQSGEKTSLSKLDVISMAVAQFKGQETPKKTMKVTKQAFKAIDHGKYDFTTKSKERYVGVLNPQSKALQLYKVENQIAQGGFGIIHRALEMNGKTSFVYKESMKAPQAREDLLNESEVATQLDHPGISKGPIAVFDGQGTGLITRMYENKSMDGDKAQLVFANATNAQKLKRMQTLGDALGYMAEKRLMHGDIKTGNFLMDGNGNIVFADFGGARFMKKGVGDNTPLKMIPYTSRYFHANDHEKVQDAVEGFNKQTEKVTEGEAKVKHAKALVNRAKSKGKKMKAAEKELKAAEKDLKAAIALREEFREKYFELRLQQDVYATGASIHEMLTGQSHLKPEQFLRGNPKSHPFSDDPVLDRELLEAAGWKGTGLIELIEKMVHPDSEKRITPQEAAKEFKRLSSPIEYG